MTIANVAKFTTSGLVGIRSKYCCRVNSRALTPVVPDGGRTSNVHIIYLSRGYLPSMPTSHHEPTNCQRRHGGLVARKQQLLRGSVCIRNMYEVSVISESCTCPDWKQRTPDKRIIERVAAASTEGHEYAGKVASPHI